MKKHIIFLIAGIVGVFFFNSCKKDSPNYPGGEISSYIGIYDVRTIFKGEPVNLSLETLGGSSKITGIVISDHSAGNLPEGLLVLQDRRRLDLLRGISIQLGEKAKEYTIGDSIVVDLVGGKLQRLNGILQITDIANEKIQKISVNNSYSALRVTAAQILKDPTQYENTAIVIVKGGFSYTPSEGQTLSGDQKINDGFGFITVRTNPKSALADLPQYKMANYWGIQFNEVSGDSLLPYQCLRSKSDLVQIKSEYKTPKAIVTGLLNDPSGSTDANYEYMQFLATEDIDFSKTPFSVVTTNNANASTPTGVPTNGWATGGLRTYKINLTAGSVKKGQFFYVGGTNKLITGEKSADISAAHWVANYDYANKGGYDFGTKTGNLLANSGNAFGVAIFSTLQVINTTIPEDVVFVSTGGSLASATAGYRIANTDFYDIVNPVNLTNQPFYRNGDNTKAFVYVSPSADTFIQFNGEFNMTLGRWTKSRVQNNVSLTKESQLKEIENEFSTKLIE
ncbi:MAG: DUF5689 domain-containing protein [Sphingobacterium sp.]|jgi:hypothetical protein|uniref:DUF5689 domain-containing protein n=1 Tax=Sphingobacterium sp. TaxID=341027 RepID=UPI002816D4A5|nr:DUF5689 domain-containing protein [Sphingobacterium sp.]MDR0262176.1 DUF5689 domain-containing protein [Sphingobacterium sp.]